MDNFIDKLAQKFTAGEVIRANTAAEERELKRLHEQVAEYERCLQEMRQVQMRNTETAQNLKEMMDESRTSLNQLVQESLAKIEEARVQAEKEEDKAGKAVEAAREAVVQAEEQVKKLDAVVADMAQAMEKNQKEIGNWFKQADDFLHKENVKVYRNVQAVVVEELGNKADTILKGQEDTGRKFSKPVLILLVLTALTATANLAVQILDIVGVF